MGVGCGSPKDKCSGGGRSSHPTLPFSNMQGGCQGVARVKKGALKGGLRSKTGSSKKSTRPKKNPRRKHKKVFTGEVRDALIKQTSLERVGAPNEVDGELGKVFMSKPA